MVMAPNGNLGGGLGSLPPANIGAGIPPLVISGPMNILPGVTSPQAINLYSMYTDQNNYSRLSINFSNPYWFFQTQSLGAGAPAQIAISSQANIFFQTGGQVTRWIIDPTGMVLANNDNTYDIGASGSGRPRNVYVAGAMNVGLTLTCNNLTVLGSVAQAPTFQFMTGSNCALYSGNTAPAAGTGNNGDYYFRNDTPATANQRIYVKSAGAWVGIV